MLSKISKERKTINIKQLQLCLKGLHYLNSNSIKALQNEKVHYFKLVNERNEILSLMEEARSMSSKTCLFVQDLEFKYKKLLKDVYVVFGPGFKYLLDKRIFERKPIVVKKMERTLKNLTKMKLPLLYDIPFKKVMPIVITMSEDKWQTDKCNEKTMSKIMTIASDNDGKLFEFIRSRIAEKLRMDIVWEDRKYIMWYKLKKLYLKIEQSNMSISQFASKYYMLYKKLKKLPLLKDIPNSSYITSMRQKCKKLEQSFEILDNYSKINEFAKWASEYGDANQSDPDIVDAVEWVNAEADIQLNLLHNELIGVRNYCNIQNMALFD